MGEKLRTLRSPVDRWKTCLMGKRTQIQFDMHLKLYAVLSCKRWDLHVKMHRVLSKDGCSTTVWSPYFTLILHLPSLFRWSAGKSFYTTLPKIKVKMRKHFFSWTLPPPPSPPAGKIKTSNALYKWVESAEFSVQPFFWPHTQKSAALFFWKITHNGIICEAASTAECLRGCWLQKTAACFWRTGNYLQCLPSVISCRLSTFNTKRLQKTLIWQKRFFFFFLHFWLNTGALKVAASVWKDRQPTAPKHQCIFQYFQTEM